MSLFFQIDKLDLVQEAMLIVDDNLLEAISLEAKSSISMAYLGIGKDIGIVRKVTSPHTIRDVNRSFACVTYCQSAFS